MCCNITKLMHSVLLLASLFLTSCGGGGGAPTAPPMPANVKATARDANNLIGWTAVSGATSYNVYWSNTSGVNKTNGTKINLANNPQAHTGLADGTTTYYYVVTALNAGGESAESVQVSATPAAATPGPDLLYPDQWHLKNIGQAGANGVPGVSGEDMNVEPVWLAATPHKGNGIRIAVVDEGLEIGHEDLAANIAATGLSYNYLTGSTDPTNDPTDVSPGNGHGTAVAGIAAARDLNGLGGSGAAPRANLVGYNLLQNQTASNEADAMTRDSPNVHIYSNSWGPPDGTGTLDAPSNLWRTAIDKGLISGRSGLGAIYIWAAGNGGNGSGSPIDNSNYDGYANYRSVIAVTAVNDQGKQSSYSEPGANIWISAPGGEFCNTHAITTTDRTGAVGLNPPDPTYGYNDYPYTSYTKCMNGTSSATPGVAGVVALMLQANPTLGWRDVRLILAQSARKNDATDTVGWGVTGGTPVYHFNHKYGFGVVDAAAAVTLASPLNWTNVGPQLISTTFSASPNQPIRDYPGTAVSSSINVAKSGITSIEYIEITFSATDHPYAGDLAITLTSPSGTVSQLSETHPCLDATGNVLATCPPYNGWVFGSARHLGEKADGLWTLTVIDGAAKDTGTFQSWGLKFYGR
jgi:proprotein convertase subtilisin/kexin type 2